MSDIDIRYTVHEIQHPHYGWEFGVYDNKLKVVVGLFKLRKYAGEVAGMLNKMEEEFEVRKGMWV